MNQKVDTYIEKAEKWQKETEQLRALLLDCSLTEDFKWMHPCYTFNGNNIALIHGFKNYCALLFHKGALLNDTEGILIQQTENVQAARQIRFTCVKEIIELAPVIKAYIYEAIEIEKAGLKVVLKKSEDYPYSEELQNTLANNPKFKTAFEALTPGRQRAYNFYINAAKQPKTREARIEKYTQRILDGYGINDCTCGFTKKKPNCDGSHKYLK